MDDSLDDQESFRQQLARATPRVWVTPVLVAINVLVWVANIITGLDPISPKVIDLARWGGNFLPLTLDQPWRLMSATVLHGGIIHLAMNMWALWSLGALAERFYGNKQYLIIYLLAGLFGSLASLYFSARSSVSVGASGAIFGVVGAILAALFTKQSKMPAALVKNLRASLLPFVLFSLFMGFSSGHIDNAAHIGGMVSGFGLAMLMAEKFDWDQYRRQAIPRALAALVVSTIVAVALWKMVPAPAA